MSVVRFVKKWWIDALALAIVGIIFVVPFVFIVFTAAKDQADSARLQFTPPTDWLIVDNVLEVIGFRNNLMVTAMRNSLILTVASVTLIVLFAAMVGFVLQRRRDRFGSVVSALMLAGLIIPPAIVPTIYVLQALGLFKTLPGLTLVEVAFLLPFSVLIFRAFVASIPRELDEAAIMDGASPLRLFFSVIFPLLRPAVITVIVVATVAVYNDFVNPLYFLPGTENATVQLTLFNFQSQFNTRWHLLFADVLLITIPPLIVFLFFQRQIVSGSGRRCGQGMTLVVQRLRSQLPDGVLAFGAEQPRLSWQVSASHPGLVQLGLRDRGVRIARLRDRARHDRPAGRQMRRSRCPRQGVRCAAGRCATTASACGTSRAGRAGATGCGSRRASSSPARGPLVRSRSRTIRAAAVSRRRRCSGGSSTCRRRSPAPGST